MSQESTPYGNLSSNATPENVRPDQGDAPTPAAADAPLRADTPLRATNQLIGHARTELGRVIAGQRPVIEEVLMAVLCQGHALLEGVPGIAKTLIVKALGRLLGLGFQRVQATPDLMPADILGTSILRPGSDTFSFHAGPVFTDLLLVDEINRMPPRTQAALLECMEERQVTSDGVRRPLPPWFTVFATQNPVDFEGTYPLPEAQLDRFMFNVVMDYLPENDEVSVVTRTTSEAASPIEALLSGQDVLRFHEMVRKVPVAEEMVRYAVKLAAASRPHQLGAPDFINEWASWGAGTRAGQFLVLGAKARALFKGRAHVTTADIQALAFPTLRHRILLNYRAEAEGISVEDVIKKLVEAVKAPLQ